MPETANQIDGRIAVSDIILHRNGNYRSFILFFFYRSVSFYLTVKSFLTDFAFFFFFFLAKILSLLPVLIQNESLIGVIYKIKSFLHHFPSSFGHCYVYGTPAIAHVSGFVMYTKLLPFKGKSSTELNTLQLDDKDLTTNNICEAHKFFKWLTHW